MLQRKENLTSDFFIYIPSEKSFISIRKKHFNTKVTLAIQKFTNILLNVMYC